MLILSIYWSYYLYADWQEKPVLTTVMTTALPVSQVAFPAVTVCSEGINCEVDCYSSVYSKTVHFINTNGLLFRKETIKVRLPITVNKHM